MARSSKRLRRWHNSRGGAALLNPEATYFWPESGKRAGMLVFDMADPSHIPEFAEQLFMNLDAEVEFTPVMNTDDLQRALAKVSA